MTRGFLGLGSNVGDKRANLEAALAALRREREIEVRRVAGFYRSAPMGTQRQDWYLNTVAEIATGLPPRSLMERCQRIEHALGRVRAERWGPRIIDIDLLWLDGITECDGTLTLPHAGAHERSFVLAPWLELAPDITLHGHPLAYWLERADPLGIARET